MVDNFSEFCERAYAVFGLVPGSAKRRPTDSYIEVPVRLSIDRLETRSGDGEDRGGLNPFIYLTGVWKERATSYSGQSAAGAPFLSFVVGHYGLGKTELLSQLCRYLLDIPAGQRPLTPLPINLAFGREYLDQLRDEKDKGALFTRLLFAKLSEGTRFDESFVREEVLPKIGRGEILLILDGLDELVSTRGEHLEFFHSLNRFLGAAADAAGSPRFRVVISTRLEYLALDRPDAGDLVDIVRRGKDFQMSISFLRLSFFGDSRMISYLAQRGITNNEDELFERIATDHRLLETLRRPLLLRIFCDLAAQSRDHRTLEELLQFRHPAQLLKAFVDTASTDQVLTDAQGTIAKHIWDTDALALQTLEHCRNGETHLDLDDIRASLKPVRAGSATVVGELSDEEVLSGIHKCPFLQKEEGRGRADGRPRVHFAHKIFFEYFTSLGMALEFGKEGQNFIAFDEIVLNVEMRKLLKGIVGDKEWYERTKRSYGLQDENEWRPRDSQAWTFELLEINRRILLDSMTDPETPPHDTARVVRWFLDTQRQWLHPRYLTYNYEAVAVYVWHHRWDPNVQTVSEEFDDTLKTRLENTLRKLNDGITEIGLRSYWELLIERILDIGQRLRYQWAKRFVQKGKREDLLNAIQEEKTKHRIKVIFSNIKDSVF